MASGAIQFVADTSQFNTATAEASKSVLNVAASAEDARKRIVDSYNQQVKAARDFGASQSQLEAITRRTSTQLASVTDDNARRYINAIDRMEERTRRFNASRQLLTTQPVSSFSFSGYGQEANAARELETAVDGVSRAHNDGIGSGAKFGAVLRVTEGNLTRSVRAAEAFGGSLKFLTPIIDAAFPVVGALALGYAVVELGKHAYEAFENVVLLRDAIKGLNELQIKVDSDHTRAQDEQENSVESILGQTQGRGAALKQKYSYQSQKPVDLSSYFYSDQFKKLPDDVKGTFEQTYKNVAPADAQARIESITNTINKLDAAIKGVKDGSIGAFLPVINGKGPSSTRDPLAYYTAQRTAADQIRTGLVDATGTRSASLQGIQTDIGTAQSEEAKKAAQAAKAASKEANAAQLRDFEDQNSRWKAAADRSLVDDALFWRNKLAILSTASPNYVAVRRKYDDDLIALNRKVAEESKSNGSDIIDQYGKDSRSNALKAGNEQAQGYIDNNTTAIDNAQNAAKTKEALITDAAGASISRYAAALQIAAVHTEEYVTIQSALQGILDTRLAQQKANPSPETDRAVTSAQAALANAQTTRGIQIGSDNNAVNGKSTSAVAGFDDAINSFVTSSRDAATQMRDLTTNTLQGLNQQIVAGISGQKTDFRGFGAGVARNVAGVALNKAEGSALGFLGLGKHDGSSASSALYVQMAGGSITSAAGSALSSLGKSGSGIGGFFGGLLSKILPGFAAGGAIDGPSIVGEKGPELFIPGSSGSIIPNNKLISGGGGDIHFHQGAIDARGATDPAQVDAAVQRGIAKAAPHLTAAAVQATNEHNKRRGK